MTHEPSVGTEELPKRAGLALDACDRALQRWALEETCADGPLFWGPHGARRPADWVRVRNVEHLAVLVSTASRRDNNVCFVSGARGPAPRRVNLIGLVSREVLGWAVVVHEPGLGARNVQRQDYPYDNYDSFSSLAAATIARTWVTVGRLPDGLVGCRRSN